MTTDVTLPSREELNSRQRALGSTMGQSIVGSSSRGTAGSSLGAAGQYAVGALTEGVPLGSASHGSAWRGIELGMDELVSTATVRELLNGIMSAFLSGAGQLQGQQKARGGRGQSGQLQQAKEAIGRVYDQFSSLRVQTEYVGYSSHYGSMQHPTSEGGGLFIGSKEQGPHGTLDRQRRACVTQAMEDKWTQSGDFESAAKEGMRVAITFTLNEMMAPITAENVQKHAAQGLNSGDRALLDQVQVREKLKELCRREYGGKIESSRNDTYERSWSKAGTSRDEHVVDNPNVATLSPRRTRRKDAPISGSSRSTARAPGKSAGAKRGRDDASSASAGGGGRASGSHWSADGSPSKRTRR